ncbi:MAG: XdhC family protein [Myxococcota bacterium]
MTPDLLNALLAARTAKKPITVITDFPQNTQRLAGPDDDADPNHEGVLQALRSDRPVLIEDADGQAAVFIRPYSPPLRMLLVGAVHIAQPLSVMAQTAGYSVTIIDPRAAFAAQERFPGVVLNDEWPDDALEALVPDARTAIVTLTHDPKLDDPALELALQSPAFYIGALGSRKTHASRLQRLAEAGFDESARGRIHGPVGLSIGARSPAEIAIAILAEVTQVLRQAPA